jgi:predicted RNA-binding Zn ribbon-like protein
MTVSITGRDISDAPALLKWTRRSQPGVSRLTASTSITVEAIFRSYPMPSGVHFDLMPRPPLERLPLIGGELCLDLANTVDPRFNGSHDEFLDSYAALVEWAVRADALDAAAGAALMRLGDRQPTQAERVRMRAVSLREAIYSVFAPAHRSRDAADGLAVLNEELRHAASHALVVPAGDDFALAYSAGDQLDPMLWPCARSAAELLLSPGRRRRVKECDGDGCGWLFVDTSKAGRRRWCSMASCGNRAKVQRYRERHEPVSGA